MRDWRRRRPWCPYLGIRPGCRGRLVVDFGNDAICALAKGTSCVAASAWSRGRLRQYSWSYYPRNAALDEGPGVSLEERPRPCCARPRKGFRPLGRCRMHRRRERMVMRSPGSTPVRGRLRETQKRNDPKKFPGGCGRGVPDWEKSPDFGNFWPASGHWVKSHFSSVGRATLS